MDYTNNMFRRVLLTLTALFCFNLLGCAGPTTPFGAPNSSDRTKVDSQRDNERVHITPDRQVYHQSDDIEVTIDDSEGVPPYSQLNVLYQGYDVTESVLARAKSYASPNSLRLDIPKIRIRPDRKNDIQFVYRRSAYSPPIVKEYDRPACTLFEDREIQEFGEFKVSKDVAKAILKVSNEMQFNPGLLAGIVAQESSYNPRASSKAGAAGLMQLTPMAALDVKSELKRKSENRVPAAMSAEIIKDENLDWRFDPEKSLRAGVVYLNHLDRYWSRKKFSSNFSKSMNPELKRTEAVLASYNAGSESIRKTIQLHGRDWLTKTQYSETKRYVPMIMSYCYHFSKEKELK
ncbi:MAG: transglycosylase SLT domain-containing protein [Bdellovibrionales bacterium]|nr:transglycosylase SLT domain-containing protein [Bdellovibrionales bacterium]